MKQEYQLHIEEIQNTLWTTDNCDLRASRCCRLPYGKSQKKAI